MQILTPQDGATHLALYDNAALPGDRNRITMPFGRAPIQARDIERSQEMVLTYFFAREVQGRALTTGQEDLLRRANDAVSEARNLFFHGRADVKADSKPPRFPSPAVLYDAVQQMTAPLKPFEHAGACAYMGTGTQQDFTLAVAALLVARLAPGEEVQVRTYEDSGGLSQTSVAVVVGPEGEVVCDGWAEGPAVLWQDARLYERQERDRVTIGQPQLHAFRKGYEDTAPQHATAIVQNMDARHRANRAPLRSPESTVAPAFDDRTHRAMGSYRNSAGVTRHTTGIEGFSTTIRHVLGGKSDTRLKQQKDDAKQARLEIARNRARDFNVEEAKVKAVAELVTEHAARLHKLETSASWRHANETVNTFVQR